MRVINVGAVLQRLVHSACELAIRQAFAAGPTVGLPFGFLAVDVLYRNNLDAKTLFK
jgi:hypothetical protein